MGYLSDFLLGFGLGMDLSTDRMCQVWIAGCFCNEGLTNVDTTFFYALILVRIGWWFN